MLTVVKILILFSCVKIYAVLPVTNETEELRWGLDLASAALSVSKLTHEFVDEVYFVKEITEVQTMIKETQELIENYNILTSEFNNLSEYEISKFKIFKEKIESLVNLIRGIKSWTSGIQTGITSRSLSAAVEVMREERQKLNEKYEMKLRFAQLKHETRKQNEELIETLKRRKALLKDYRDEESRKNDWSLRLF